MEVRYERFPHAVAPCRSASHQLDGLLECHVGAPQPRGYLYLVWGFKILPSSEPGGSARYAHPRDTHARLSLPASLDAPLSSVGNHARLGGAPRRVPVWELSAALSA